MVTTYGYPGDIQNGNWLINTTGTPDAYNGNILLFRDDLDAAPGQSGSPVLTSSQTQDDVVVGVVSHHSYFPNENGVLTFDAEAVKNIDEWISQNDANLIQPKTTSFSFDDVEDISLLYMGLLGRTPDEDGLKYWVQEQDSGKKFHDIIKGFLDSDELNTNSDYTGDSESFVTNLYKNILLREPDEGGLNYWINELDNYSSKEKIVSGFIESGEYTQAQSLNTYIIWHNWFESFSREINGTSSSEIFKASSSDDYINAGAGNDTIDGLGGNDYIYGNIGNDTLTGGDGSDYFVFDLTQDGMDTITDFNIQDDKINILSGTQDISLATIQGEDTLVLYEDDNSFIVLSGLTTQDYANITFI